MESDETLVDVVSHDEQTGLESDTTMSADESEDVDIMSDFVSPEFNTSQNNTPSISTKPSDTTDSEEHSGYSSTFAGDHNYCCAFQAPNTESGQSEKVTESEKETERSGWETLSTREIEQSGNESSPKVIIESQLGNRSEAVYCICRRPDVDEFMIGCDACDEWYHGTCIGITKKDAKKIKQFFCHVCQEKNPSLKTKFKNSNEKGSRTYQTDETDENPKQKQRSSRRCGECTACNVVEDCGKCDYCLDMRKFGGPNKKRQKCRLRQCLNKSMHLNIQDFSLKDEERIRKARKIRQPKRRHEDFDGSSNKKHAIKLKHTRHLQGKEQKLKRQLSEKEQRRRKRLASRENSGSYSERTRQKTVEIPRQCYGAQCQKRARSNSKYCSHECGIQLAVRRIQEILPGRVKEWNETTCVANVKAEEKLQKLKKVQENTRARLLELDKQSKELDDILERASHLTAVNEEDTENEQDTDIDLSIHCVTCGIALLPKVALRHMEKCYMKNESFTSFGSNFKSVGNLFCDFYNSQQKTYCKRLRVLCPEHTKEAKVSPHEVCGCPLTNDQLEETKYLCCVSKRNCIRHYCWEKLRRAQIDGERVRQWLKLEEVYEQEKHIRMAMSQRGGVLSLLLHRTIVER